jgi:hypothetical protein
MKEPNEKLLDSFIKVYYCPNFENFHPVSNHPLTVLIKTTFQRLDYAWYDGYECPICRWQFLEHELNEKTNR